LVIALPPKSVAYGNVTTNADGEEEAVLTTELGLSGLRFGISDIYDEYAPYPIIFTALTLNVYDYPTNRLVIVYYSEVVDPISVNKVPESISTL